ncbi:MAG: hypothetical protein GXY77_02635 [Fibrobacter sp.]|nr:hypothetical protein [Fibrobacter sp.]
MLPGKLLIIGVISVMVMVGCAKKDSQKDIEFSQQSDTPSLSETEDIFDEFYKSDSSTDITSSESNSEETFSTSGGTPVPKQTGNYIPEFSENGRYVVQVSTVGPRSIADELTAKLNTRGYPAYIAEVTNPTPELFGTYYRIRIGGFHTVSAARNFGENTLRTEGYDYWVDNKSNDNVGIDGSGLGSNDSYGTDSYGSQYDSESYSSEPYSEPSVTTEPVTTEPVTTEPVTTEPVTTEPITTEPPVSETQSIEALPESTEPLPETETTGSSESSDFDSNFDSSLDSDWSDDEW